MKKHLTKQNILTLLLFAGIVFAVMQIGRSAPPDPGHAWPDIGDNADDALTVSRGGTGTTTLTAENVLLGDTANAVKFVAPGTSGNVLTSNGTTWAGSELGGLVLLNPSTSEANSSAVAANTTEQTLKSWVLNVSPSTYRYYILEAEVMANDSASTNANVNFNWNFDEGTNSIEVIQWRMIGTTITGIVGGTRYAATIKALVDSANVPASANFRINGQMSASNAAFTMMAHSFRVYGVK
jgi:hypothetical protein